jgi:hypothetical protein
MRSTTERRVSISQAPLAKPRLRMQQDQASATLLDGGWWPRSADPAAELTGLIPALDERHGRITRIMLGTTDWDASRPRWLPIGSPPGTRIVKIGWFHTMPAGLLTAISARGERTDLVTIPPHTSEQAASSAMRQAAEAGNREHAPAILAALAKTAGEAAASSRPGVPEWDGGQLVEHQAARRPHPGSARRSLVAGAGSS